MRYTLHFLSVPFYLHIERTLLSLRNFKILSTAKLTIRLYLLKYNRHSNIQGVSIYIFHYPREFRSL